MKKRGLALIVVAILMLLPTFIIPNYIPDAHATVNATQLDPVVAFPMDTVIADKYNVPSPCIGGVSGYYCPTNNLVRMLDATPFHNDAKACSNSALSSYVVGVNGGAQLFTGGQCWQVASNANIHADSLGNYMTVASWIRVDQNITTVATPAIDGNAVALTSGTSVSVSLTTANTHDVIIAFCAGNSASLTFTVSDVSGLTWTQRSLEQGNGLTIEEFYANSANMLSSDSITCSASASAQIRIFTYGVNGVYPAVFDSNVSHPIGGTGVSSVPSVTLSTTSANTFVFAGVLSSLQAENAGSGFTLVGSSSLYTSEYKVVSSVQTNLAVPFSASATAWVEIGDTLVVPLNAQYIISKAAEYGIYVPSDGKIRFEIGNSVFSGATTLSVGLFYHVAAVWNSTHVQLYLNGRNDTNWSAFSSTPTENSNALVIGAYDTTSSQSFYGIIDEVYVFKRPLSLQEMSSIMLQPMPDRSSTNYIPDTTAGTTGFNNNNPELPFATATTSVSADINSTTYLPGPIAVHQVVNITTSGTTGKLSCNAGMGQANTCNHFRYQWSLFRQGVFQEALGVLLEIRNSTGACSGSFPCTLLITFYYISANALTLYTNSVSNSSATLVKQSWWIGIDFWVTQDSTRVGVRATNFDGANTGPWSTSSIQATGINNQFLEHFFTLIDSSGNTHTIDWFDTYIQQNTEVFAQATGVGTAPPKVQIIDHRAGFIKNVACAAVISGILGFLVGTVVNMVFHPCATGVGPPTSPGTTGGTGGTSGGLSCGLLQSICDGFGNLVNGIVSGFQAIVTPLINAVLGLPGAIATFIASTLKKGAIAFLNALDPTQGLTHLIFGPLNAQSIDLSVIPGFTTVSGTSGMLGIFFQIISPFINAIVDGFFSTTTFGLNLIRFLTGSNKEGLLGAMLYFMNQIFNPTNVFSTTLYGATNFFLGFLGISSSCSTIAGLSICSFSQSASTTTVTVIGRTYNLGPAPQIMVQMAPLFFILMAVWYIKVWIHEPWHTTIVTFDAIYKIGSAIIVVVGWFFELFLKIVEIITNLLSSGLSALGGIGLVAA